MKKQPAKQESKVLVFPGNDNDPNAPPFQLVLTPITLGKGQFGLVHFAHTRHDQNQVYAVKVIDRQKVANQRANQNLQNEIAIMAEINSPYVVALKDATKTANNFYLAMELCNGGDLANLCKVRGGYLKEKECQILFKQIIEGLTAIKETKVMHRDLKLPNIMIHFPQLAGNVCIDPNFNMSEYLRTVEITEDNIQCKIADLGFARKLGNDEMAMTSCGTPLQMPPEVLEGKLYDHKADVWSLGCIFYEMLCGFPPFTGRNQRDLTNNIAKGVYKFPKTLKISIEGLTFLNQMLQYDYTTRMDWEELQKCVYIRFAGTQNYDQQPEELFMSYCADTHQFQADGPKSNKKDIHEQVIRSPYQWMNKNPEQALVLNARDESNLNEMIQQRYMKYQERLQKEENNVAAAVLNQSKIVNHLNKDVPQSEELEEVVNQNQLLINPYESKPEAKSIDNSDNFKTAGLQQEQPVAAAHQPQIIVNQVSEEKKQILVQPQAQQQPSQNQNFDAKRSVKPLSMDNTEFRQIAQPEPHNQVPNVFDIAASQPQNEIITSLTDDEKKQIFKVEETINDQYRQPSAFVDVMEESTYGLVAGKTKAICRNLVQPGVGVNSKNLNIRLALQICEAETVAPQFDIYKWIRASLELEGRYQLLEQVFEVMPGILQSIKEEYGHDKPYELNVLTAEQFQNVLRRECPRMSEGELDLIARYGIKGSRRTPQPGEILNLDLKSDMIHVKHFDEALCEVVNKMRKEQIEKTQKQQAMQLMEGQAAKRQRLLEEQKQQQEEQKKMDLNPEAWKRQQQVIQKVLQVFREREISFYEAFQEFYDPLKAHNMINMKQFKECVQRLNLPLTVQDMRNMRRIADPQGIGKVDLNRFCPQFETFDLRQTRLNMVLDKIATCFYLQNFNLKKAFNLFDANGDGVISASEFRQGINSLHIGMSFDEIADLQKIISSRPDGKISYDDFISTLDTNIRHRKHLVTGQVDTQLFIKVNDCLQHSRESLYEVMKRYDYDNKDVMEVDDLPRVFKRLGLSTVEPHLDKILEAGKAQPGDNKINISSFVNHLTNEISRRCKESDTAVLKIMGKLHSLLKSLHLSVFDLFVKLDSNGSTRVSKIELKTGLQSLGMVLEREEFILLWKALHKPIKKLHNNATAKNAVYDSNKPGEEMISYVDLINAFVKAGCIRLQKSTDRVDVLVGKYRSMLKRLNLSIEKAFRAYDPQEIRYVFRNDFIDMSLMLGLDFSEDELSKVFTVICMQGKKEGTEPPSRFDFKQFHDTLLVQKDVNWLYQAYIKIHSVVVQKGLTYKRLFGQWKTGKGGSGDKVRLSAPEITSGLKKLKAGLTNDEIEKLVAQQRFEGKDLTIGANDFEQAVVDGARKLEEEQSFERMLLADWISQFNEQMTRNQHPLDSLFQEFDIDQEGSLSFENFSKMNEYEGVCMAKKDLQRIFTIIDRNKNGRIRVDELRSISSLTYVATEEDKATTVSNLHANELLLRQKVDDIYEELKNKIEAKNLSLENVLFKEPEPETKKSSMMNKKPAKKSNADPAVIAPNQQITTEGIREGFERLQIVMSEEEAQRIILDIREGMYGKFELCYKDMIDYLTKRRVNITMTDKGFVDPLLASSVTALNKIKDYYNLTVEKVFGYLSSEMAQNSVKAHDSRTSGKSHGGPVYGIGKEQFVQCLQGMNLGVAIEDITELFGYMDVGSNNVVDSNEFNNAITFVSNKIGGPSGLEQSMAKSLISGKKNQTNTQLVSQVLNKVCDGICKKNLSIKQLFYACDVNKNGYFSRAEFCTIVNQLNENIPLEHVRILMQFFDDRNTGKIAILEFLKVCQEILNNMIGGGVYAWIQVQPILVKIINELSIDCDRFFDEVANLNQEWIIKQEAEKRGQQLREPTAVTNSGLSKIIFFNQLRKYGVVLTEQEKSLITSTFTLGKHDRNKLHYEKLDSAFEGVQQQLYFAESQYTQEWERRVFKKIGEYLMRFNKSVQECFKLIDTDETDTVQMSELRTALIPFDLGLSDKEIKIFLNRLDPNNKGYMSQDEFIQRFWAAYTYDDVHLDQDLQSNSLLQGIQMGGLKEETSNASAMTSHNIQAANRKIKSQLDMKVNSIRMFKQIQKRIKDTMSASDAFLALDTNRVGFLTLRDFQINFSKHFDLSLKAQEVRQIFSEIDEDENGIIKIAEFSSFYDADYNQRFLAIKCERSTLQAQNEIFDHLMKVLKQRGLTLQQVFDQIDDDKNNYIEVDEFHDMLERMGFTITQDQVFDLMKVMDDNFDGRISYSEMRAHMEKLGFSISEAEATADKAQGDTATKQLEFKWRDKALELIIRSIKSKLGTKMSMRDYFTQYDKDHDQHLSPKEFRQALVDLGESQLKQTQIERILHILLEEKKLQPLILIDRAVKLFQNYKWIELNDGSSGSQQSVLIDEDLFVYIVEKYDGLSRMMEFTTNVEDRSCYLQRHTHEITMRGLDLASNQKVIQKLTDKGKSLNELYRSTLTLLAGEITRLIKDEAIMCVLDPSTNIDTIVSDTNVGVLNSVNLPTIENSQFDVDYNTLQTIPCGAQQYQGTLVRTKQPVDILLYQPEFLSYVSLDGKTFKRHLATELQVHRYLMGARFEDDDEMVNPDAFSDDSKLDIFANIGKFEKKIGLNVNEKEIYVVNKAADFDEWICLDDFVTKNGGVLNIPLFYHTDAPLFIIRHWAKLILQIIHKLHDVSIVLRCLSTKQLWISRDGQRIKLGNVRGVGKVNNLGYISSCPDIYLNLDNNEKDPHAKGSSTMSPSRAPGGGEGGFTSSRKTEAGGGRQFSNQCLDSPFLPPEMLFQKFQDHTAAIDVWAFGMVMFCLIFGRKPVSFYQAFRQWYLKSHGVDVEMGTLPFTPANQKNFLYDPFSIDFENPFDKVTVEDIERMANGMHCDENSPINDIDGKFRSKDGSLNFENFMKCIRNLSYSSMFSDGNSKKFHYDHLSDKTEQNANPTFAGQAKSTNTVRKSYYKQLAKDQVLQRKNELGLILDLISGCLDVDVKRRPTIQGLLNSPIFMLDTYERTNAVRFSQNVILYRSPQQNVSMSITYPLRQICAEALKAPMSVFEHVEAIQKLFVMVEDKIQFITSFPIDEINEVLTDEERRKGTSILKAAQRKDQSSLRVCPNSSLAAQVIDDKVIDMLLFITFRHMKHFAGWKAKRMAEIETNLAMSRKKNVDETTSIAPSGTQRTNHLANRHEQMKKQMQRLDNKVLALMTRLLKTMVYQMHSYNTPMAPFVSDVINYVVKFFLGEEHTFGSETVLRKSGAAQNSATSQLKDFLRERSFFRRETELSAEFKSDATDKLWHLEQKNQTFLDKSNYWCAELHREALKIYRDAISESGLGQSCYPVINDYITSINNSFEPTKIFSKQMNHLSLSYLIPTNRTQAYYNELIPLAESISRLYNPDLEKSGKRCSLAMVRSVFQTGNSDKIKACLDMRVPKHLIHFLQDTDAEIRRECLHTFLEISKGLQDDDFEVIGKHAANLKREFSKHGYTKTAFDLHKAVSMASQQEVLDAQQKLDQVNEKQRRGSKQAKQGSGEQAKTSDEDAQTMYIKRTIALIEKNETEKYINFALDLPNLNFLASKRFLKEMAVCFESPVFIAPLTRLLKTPSEQSQNKELILELFKNLLQGNERVLIAFNSPACDSYMTLLKILITNTKLAHARSNPTSGIPTQMKQTLALQDKTVGLFDYLFEQRRPTIVRDVSCIGASATLLKEQGLTLPKQITLPDIMEFFDLYSERKEIRPQDIVIGDLTSNLKDLRCWIKHFYNTSPIPELTRIKALQRCMNTLIRFLKVLWKDYFREHVDQWGNEEASPEKKIDYMTVIRMCLTLFDWLCINDKTIFLFNEECGRTNLAFIINMANGILSQFRKPLSNKELIDAQETAMPPLEDLTFNDRSNKKVQQKRRYDIFPFTDTGSILQNIQYQLIRKNDPFINRLLSEANFGFIFGEQMLLDLEFIRHCIDNQVESLVLMDSYVKKNEIRLNTFEFLMRNSEPTIKDQFIKSNFCEYVFLEFIKDYREFNIQFSKIDLEFLAFRRSYPLRLEAISLVNTALTLKNHAPQIYSEILMYARRHMLIRTEMATLQASACVNSKEATVLLLFAIILESNEADLIYVMVQEGAAQVVRQLIQEQPSLNKRFPILKEFVNRF